MLNKKIRRGKRRQFLNIPPVDLVHELDGYEEGLPHLLRKKKHLKKNSVQNTDWT